MEKKPLLLYLDIPFCPGRCAHCAKPALEPRADWREGYIEAPGRGLPPPKDNPPPH